MTDNFSEILKNNPEIPESLSKYLGERNKKHNIYKNAPSNTYFEAGLGIATGNSINGHHIGLGWNASGYLPIYTNYIGNKKDQDLSLIAGVDFSGISDNYRLLQLGLSGSYRKNNFMVNGGLSYNILSDLVTPSSISKNNNPYYLYLPNEAFISGYMSANLETALKPTDKLTLKAIINIPVATLDKNYTFTVLDPNPTSALPTNLRYRDATYTLETAPISAEFSISREFKKFDLGLSVNIVDSFKIDGEIPNSNSASPDNKIYVHGETGFKTSINATITSPLDFSHRKGGGWLPGVR